MNQNYIITPTFRGHFKFIGKYLESFTKYVVDPKSVVLCFTISEEEREEFEKIASKYPNAQIKICIFEKILKSFNINDTTDELIQKYGKFSFQTLKKLLTILYLQAPRCLILDSESMWIRECSMGKLFDDYFESPYLTVSSIHSKKWDSFTKQEIYNINYALEMKCQYWPLENFVWFYDINILNDLVSEYGAIIDIVENVWNKTKFSPWQSGVFEILLYQQYILKNLDKYSYEVIHIDEKLKEVLSQKAYRLYVQRVEKRYGYGGGLAEHLSESILPDEAAAVGKMLEKCKQSIIRCDGSLYYSAYENEKILMDSAAPVILAASQEHYFGINENRMFMLKNALLNKLRLIKRVLRYSVIEKMPSVAASKAAERAVWDFRIQWENYEFREFLKETDIEEDN